jgi:hypothetical protein
MKISDKQQPAYFISGILAVILFGVVAIWVGKEIQSEYPRSNDFFDAEQGEQESSDAVATIGQEFIVTLASYRIEQGAPVLLNKAEQIAPNRWIVTYDVNQIVGEVNQNYFYSVEVLDHRVMSHTVELTDARNTFMITEPQPEQVLEASELALKGELLSDQARLDITVATVDGVVLAVETITLNQGQERRFSEVLAIDYAGEVLVTISSGASSISIPVILANQQPIS